MAFTATITAANSAGNLKQVHGTFTSAAGDTTLTLSNTTHGLDYIASYDVKLDTDVIDAQTPKVTISSGTLTAVWQNTQGYSGKFSLTGR